MRYLRLPSNLMKKCNLIALQLSVLCTLRTISTEYDYNMLWVEGKIDERKDRCNDTAVGDDLRVIDLCLIQIDESTGMKTDIICDYRCDKQYFKNEIGQYWKAIWKWEGRTVTIALLVARIGETRANENPVAFYSTKYEGCKYSPRTGTGSDFSKMYHKNPFRPGPMKVILMKDQAHVKVMLDFKPLDDCYATDTWIANEGWYVLDKNSRTWYPIYFDPHMDQAFFL